MSDVPAGRPRRETCALTGRGPGTLHFLDFGDPNRPVDVVFLHANGFNGGTYSDLLAPLASRFRVIATDQRGHGASSLEANPSDRRDWHDLRDDLLAFLSALDIKNVVLAGHSMGGAVCLLAAAHQPNACRRMVLFDPVIMPSERPPSFHQSPISEAAGRRRAVFPSRADALRSYIGRGAFSTWPDTIVADYVNAGFHDLSEGGVTLACAPAWEASGFAAHGHDTWQAIRRTERPIEILRAETGSTCHMSAAENLDPTRIRVETVAGSTHFLPMEKPDRFRAALSGAILADAEPPKALIPL
jgi:pimeloyl-ACP methyl ester carboxylesterase